MFSRLFDRIKRKKNTAKDADRFNNEVEIPVGGITADGIIYEREVRPMGHELLYKEVRIDDQKEVQETTEEKKPT